MVFLSSLTASRWIVTTASSNFGIVFSSERSDAPNADDFVIEKHTALSAILKMLASSCVTTTWSRADCRES